MTHVQSALALPLSVICVYTCISPQPCVHFPHYKQSLPFRFSSLADRTITADQFFEFPSFTSLAQKGVSKHDLIDYSSDEGIDVDIFNQDMAGSPTPYIKDEPIEMSFNQRFANNGFDMEHQYSGQAFGQSHDNTGSVNPSELHMMNQQFGSHGMSSSYIMGQANIGDDELEQLGNLDDGHSQPFGTFNNHQNQQQFYNDSSSGGPVNITDNNQISQMYSHTPEGAPIQSPFMNGGFNYGHFQQQRQSQPHNIVTQGGSMPNGGFVRPRMPQGLDRHGSDSRSPMTPKTAGISGLHIGTPESGSFGSHPMIHRHQNSASGPLDHTPNSTGSWIDSPLSSPHQGSLHHAQINEVIASGKHQSLPNKVEPHGSAYQSQEAKRKKRRESHNAVERRRRDNINERIHDLSRLVPSHRLEDERVRKHIHNNGPLSPSLTAGGISPPQATSLLAGGTGRRAAGSITQGLPLEDKDKGPNKGDILNGAVSWTRDLMWMLYEKIRREEELKALITDQLHGDWPFEYSEDETRMRTELIKAVESNGTESFSYTRGPGSGLRVPGHTTVAGEQLPMSPHGLSPGLQSGGSGSNSGQGQLWMNSDNNGHGSFSLKEEDEFSNMDMA